MRTVLWSARISAVTGLLAMVSLNLITWIPSERAAALQTRIAIIVAATAIVWAAVAMYADFLLRKAGGQLRVRPIWRRLAAVAISALYVTLLLMMFVG